MRKLGIALFILLICLLFACSIQKRVYRNGYYFSSSGNHSNTKSSLSEPVTHAESEKIISKRIESRKDLNLSEGDSIKNQLPVCKDAIYFKNGKKIKVKVVDETIDSVKYQICDIKQTKLQAVSKNEIARINYSELEGVIKKSEGSNLWDSKSGKELSLVLFCIAAGLLIIGLILNNALLAIISLVLFLIGFTTLIISFLKPRNWGLVFLNSLAILVVIIAQALLMQMCSGGP